MYRKVNMAAIRWIVDEILDRGDSRPFNRAARAARSFHLPGHLTV